MFAISLIFLLIIVWIRKRLEPLEAYVPAIILTEMQIQELGKIGSLNLIFATTESVTCNGISTPYYIQKLQRVPLSQNKSSLDKYTVLGSCNHWTFRQLNVYTSF